MKRNRTAAGCNLWSRAMLLGLILHISVTTGL